MEGDGPAKKRVKRNAKTTDDVPNEPSLGASSPVVKSSSFNQAVIDVVKRKIPKPKASQAPAPTPKEETKGPAPESPKTKHAPEESAEPSPTELIDLNEQCMLEVLQRLKLSGLCSMAEVCVYLREVAQKFFAIKHRKVSLTSLADTPDGKYSVFKVRQLLYNFGHLISSLTIDFGQIEDRDDVCKVLTMVRKYCLDTIDELVFMNQPNERVGERFVLSLLGGELMTRDFGPGSYVGRNTVVYKPGTSIQTQTMEQVK